MDRDRPYDGASKIQDRLIFGEFGEVNPSISDSSTFTFLDPKTMEEVFHNGIAGCFLYSRHSNPTTDALAKALADLEGTEAAVCTASGIAAIAGTILQLCSAGDEIVSARTIYGGTYALMTSLLPRLGIKVRFVDIHDLNSVRAAIRPATKLLYCESMSNPLLLLADLGALADIAHARGIQLVVDNTFSPLIITPARFGADVVIHSLTKFINGTSDCVAGVVCCRQSFADQLIDVNSGTLMLLGPVLDPIRAASILKNLHVLHVRMAKHSENALRVARALEEDGYRVFYPGLPSHPQHEFAKKTFNPWYGFGGMVTFDMETHERAMAAMKRMQEELVGYLAVSLGYFKTLFSSPAHSTSSEIPEDEQRAMGLGPGLIRMSVGIDHDIDRTIQRLRTALASAVPAG